MIALVNADDGMDQQSFAHRLETVALKLAAKGGKYSTGSASATCKPNGHKVSISTSDFPGEGSWSYQNQVRVDDRPPLTSP